MKADLHVHTSYSRDSKFSPQEMVKAALQKGMDCIAICDHGRVEGAARAVRFASNLPILIIPGIEIKSKEGDILGLNIKKIIVNSLSAEETIKKIKWAGGMAIIPHPFVLIGGFKRNLKEMLDIIDGIEVLNATIFGSGNQKALDFAKKYNLPFTVGSDAHGPELIGKAYLEIPGNNLSIEQVFKEIKNKNVKIKGGEASFFEKVIDHSRRNLTRIESYVGRKKKEF